MLTTWRGEEVLLGVVAHAFFDWAAQPDRMLADIRAMAGYRDVGVLELGRLPDEGNARKADEAIATSGFQRVFTGSGPFSTRSRLLLSESPAVRRTGMEQAKRDIDYAVAVGANMLALCPGKDLGPEARPKALGCMGECLIELARYAAGRSGSRLSLAIEIMDRGVHHDQVLASSAEGAAFLDSLGGKAPNLGLFIDLAHIPMTSESTSEAVTNAAPHLLHVHIGNCILQPGHPLYGDRHPPFAVDDGEIGEEELASFFLALDEVGYFGRTDLPFGRPALSIEIIPSPETDPLAVLAQAIPFARGVWHRSMGTGPGGTT